MRQKIIMTILIIALIVTGCSYYDAEPINDNVDIKIEK